jgi:DNA-binding CsgD family transcriptional regulator
MDLRDFSDLVGLAYDAAFEPGFWPIVLNRLATCSGRRAELRSLATIRGLADVDSFIPEPLRNMSAVFGILVPHAALFCDYGKNHPIATVMQPEMFVSREEYCSIEIFNEWFKPQQAEAMIDSKLLIDGPVSMFLALMRPYSDGDFEKAEARLFDVLIPHLQKRSAVAAALGGSGGTGRGLGHDPEPATCRGVLLVDAQSRVLFANPAAEMLFRARSGLFSGPDGLRAESPGDTRRLRKTIADCADWSGEIGGAGGRLRLSREDQTPLIVLVIPQRSQLGWIDVVRPRAILFITDPEHTTNPRGGNLRDDFGLTPAETALALEILKTDGLKAAANRLGISLATAHTQLAHVFDKTGTRRQAELVRLILQSQPAIREE